MAKKPESFDVGPKDVYALTGLGNRELRASGTSLPAAELALLVLIDGKASVAQIEHSAKGQSPEQLRTLLGTLYEKGLIDLASRMKGDFFSLTMPLQIPKAAAAEKQREASEGVSSLQDKGYFVSIARRTAGGHPLPEGRKPVMLLIDDDDTLVKLLHTVFQLEGFELRTAANRAGVGQAFDAQPPPDLALLDVVLPDIDGFEVLGRIRSHPTLKALPVIMLTAQATRESVLNGLHLGADGYVTKPFEIEVLLDAVRTVLGASALPKSGGPIRND
ncbi:MAG TPA: response regulator [Burkholderiales bacterium]|nr:response regulator [Burkholderiales bacterium]